MIENSVLADLKEAIWDAIGSQAQIEFDNDGQIIIYTNLTAATKGDSEKVIDFDPDNIPPYFQ